MPLELSARPSLRLSNNFQTEIHNHIQLHLTISLLQELKQAGEVNSLLLRNQLGDSGSSLLLLT
jgi:hypothetical protein